MRESYDFEKAAEEAEELKRVAAVIEGQSGNESEGAFDSLTCSLASVNVDAQKLSREFRNRMFPELSQQTEVDLTEAYTGWKGEELKSQDQYYATGEGFFDHYRFRDDIRRFLGESFLELYLKENERRAEAYKNAEQEAMKVYKEGERILKIHLERGEMTQDEFAAMLSGLREDFESAVQQAMQSHKPLIHIEIVHVEGDGTTFATSRTKNTYTEKGDKVDAETPTDLLFASEGVEIIRGKEIVNESDRRPSDHGLVHDREVVVPHKVTLKPGQIVVEQTGGNYRIIARD